MLFNKTMSSSDTMGSKNYVKQGIEAKDLDGTTDDSAKDASKEKQRKLTRLIYPSLSIYETSFLTGAWIFILGYSWYLVYTVSRKYYPLFIKNGFMIKTWFNQFFSYQADFTDNEWNVFSGNLVYTIPWIVFHFIGSQLLRRTNKNLVPIFNVLLSMIYMGRVMGTKPTIWMFCQPFFMFIIHLMGSSLLVWFVALAFLIIPG